MASTFNQPEVALRNHHRLRLAVAGAVAFLIALLWAQPIG